MTQAQVQAPKQASVADELAQIRAEMAALRAENAALKAAKPAEQAFEPVLTLIARPVGWVRDGQDARYASTRPKLAITLKRFANGGTKFVGNQGGFDAMALAAILDAEPQIREWLASVDPSLAGEDE